MQRQAGVLGDEDLKYYTHNLQPLILLANWFQMLDGYPEVGVDELLNGYLKV